MHNVAISITSFTTYAALAMWQTISIPELSIVKDLGMGGAFIVTVIFIIKYFMTQLEKKDSDNKEMVRNFMEMSEKFIATSIKNEAKLEEILLEMKSKE